MDLKKDCGLVSGFESLSISLIVFSSIPGQNLSEYLGRPLGELPSSAVLP